MTPNVVYDISQDGWTLDTYGAPAAVTFAFWLGALYVIVRDRRRLWHFPAVWQLFVLLACLPTTVLGRQWYRYRDAVAALADGRVLVVEGVSHDYSLKQEGRMYVERFSVDDVSFRYSWHDATRGFRTTRREGGPMENGMRVRIHYVPDLQWKGVNCILRLEILH